ncbi:hypothetical protein A5731_22665 [Mycolicibacterium conceptionense]|uniref:Uncharacterized protein n=1 Tax=Mycolicibacterium conceptionense TaxID=451644 RepID=A0A1A0PLC9_9MYCO|nr:hypothetical protein [Mycolicibacterium conceptionense]OBB10721.1 hypothetical protein A5718_07875 [Mycolicibacterium conceptionense]OBE98501.1 hypothetical protein A5731_22665 [Mycolicibacterium conceptionense]OBF15032.1 hypothetical protein A5726_22905 [Mycolicibacterium conceptionense]OBF30635.1 hypothetical protein A5720_29780 [Mycolicibacterium conceptionense]OBH94982.1 hypothetical protein A5716_23480 [Mycolicibacterium conceptionense]
MSVKVIRCDRCRRRYRNTAGWNADLIAGLIVGYLCPDCQAPQEDLEAELNLITGASVGYAITPEPTVSFVEQLVRSLIQSYPTPEVMRDRADRLESARGDAQATDMVRLMRSVADDMETGDLWEDANV